MTGIICQACETGDESLHTCEIMDNQDGLIKKQAFLIQTLNTEIARQDAVIKEQREKLMKFKI